MRPLDLLGMILTIIGVNIIIVGLFLIITIPPVSYPYTIFQPLRVAAGIIIMIGASIFVIGIIIRIVSYITKDKVSKRDLLLELINDIVNYLKMNKGKAFTMKALLNRINIDDQIEIDQAVIRAYLHDFIIRNEIKSQLKDGEEFLIYIKDI
ncbi:MAG: hypothetical protein ACFE8E_11745 [Candidatus Hodarchaeota archaeon]